MVEMAKQLEVVLEGFAEADAGVDDDGVPLNTRLQCGFDLLLQVVVDVGDDIGIGRFLLHGLGGALHVHEDDAGAMLGGERCHGGIVTEGGDIVDDVGAGVEGGFGYGGFGGIDGDELVGVFLAEGFDDGLGALYLFFCGYGLCAGAGGFSANVDDVGSVLNEGFGVLDGGGDGVVLSAVGEGVGGGVEDAHEEGVIA